MSVTNSWKFLRLYVFTLVFNIDCIIGRTSSVFILKLRLTTFKYSYGDCICYYCFQTIYWNHFSGHWIQFWVISRVIFWSCCSTVLSRTSILEDNSLLVFYNRIENYFFSDNYLDKLTSYIKLQFSKKLFYIIHLCGL